MVDSQSNISYPDGESFGAFTDGITHCCPYNQQPSYNKSNIPMWQGQCNEVVCFTSNETLARKWGACVEEYNERAGERMKGEGEIPRTVTVQSEGGGRCEYIDYEMLRKEVRNDARSVARPSSLISVVGGLSLFLALFA